MLKTNAQLRIHFTELYSHEYFLEEDDKYPVEKNNSSYYQHNTECFEKLFQKFQF